MLTATSLHARGKGFDERVTVMPTATSLHARREASPFSERCVRNGETVWEADLPNVEASALEGGRLLLEAEDASIPIEMEDWLEAVFRGGGLLDANGATVAHTADGRAWSPTTWKEVAEEDAVTRLSLYGTDDFLLVVDQSTLTDFRLHMAAVGFPLE